MSVGQEFYQLAFINFVIVIGATMCGGLAQRSVAVSRARSIYFSVMLFTTLDSLPCMHFRLSCLVLRGTHRSIKVRPFLCTCVYALQAYARD